MIFIFLMGKLGTEMVNNLHKNKKEKHIKH